MVRTYIIRLLPLLNSVKGAGKFHHAINAEVPRLLEDLRKAGNEDRFDMRELLSALAAIPAAGDFEAQQVALCSAIATAEGVLDKIADGTIETLEHPIHSVASLKAEISSALDAIVERFQVSPKMFARMRKDAAELCNLAHDSGEQAMAAERIYNLADGLSDLGFAAREKACDAIRAEMGRLAA